MGSSLKTLCRMHGRWLGGALLALSLSDVTHAQLEVDSDSDGMPDYWEAIHGLDPYSSSTSSEAMEDSDQDGLININEFIAGTFPQIPDSDADFVYDGADPWPTDPRYAQDSDGDGLPDSWELSQNLNPTDPSDAFYNQDGDGLTALEEFTRGTFVSEDDSDGDFVPDDLDPWPLNPFYKEDADRDGLPDSFELRYTFLHEYDERDAQQDFDGDGLSALAEFLAGTRPDEPDTDGDGLVDGEDVVPSDARYQLDSDGDGLPDRWEELYGLVPIDPLDALDPFNPDPDLLSPLREFALGTDPTTDDSDGDGAIDYFIDRWPLDPLYALDEDRDGLPQNWESAYGYSDFDPTDANNYTDGDGLLEPLEFARGTSPLLYDTDADGVNDFRDLWPLDPTAAHDHDGDGLPTSWELRYQLDPYQPAVAEDDFDADGLADFREFTAGSDPTKADTDGDLVSDLYDRFPLDPAYDGDNDGDGLPDRYEVERQHFLNPWDSVDALTDFDGDDLDNLSEFLAGSDPESPDTDLDGFPDGVDFAPVDADYAIDDDRDGLPANWELQWYLNDWDVRDALADVDGDFLINLREFQLGTDPTNPDSDGDRVPDAHDRYPADGRYTRDDDRDTMPREWEERFALNDGDAFDAGMDFDGDGLSNWKEFAVGTRPDMPDSDYDTVPDGEDLWPLDRSRAFDDDRDGMPLWFELVYGFNDQNPGDALLDPDTDNFTNLQEYQRGTRPDLADTDGDKIPDGDDLFPADPAYGLDADADGLPDAYEDTHPELSSTDPYDAQQDNDGDSLSNLQEFLAGTNPFMVDSDQDGVTDEEDIAPLNSRYRHDDDGDGMPDGYEFEYGFNPYDSIDAYGDADGDELTNLAEYQKGTDPRQADTDGDGTPDQVDLYPLDSRYSLDWDHDGLPREWEQMFGLNDEDIFDVNSDHDNDLLTAGDEFALGTNPIHTDSDNDSVNDGSDQWPLDPTRAYDRDSDGLPDAWEESHNLSLYFPAFVNDDTDGDGLSDLDEFTAGTRPDFIDSDGDGVVDGADAFPADARYTDDADNDGLPAAFELAHPSCLSDSVSMDSSNDCDGDFRSNLDEFIAGTAIDNADTDGDGENDRLDVAPLDPTYQFDADRDGLPNAYEFAYGFDPYNRLDAGDLYAGDDDQLTPLQEYQLGTDPTNPDTDGDYVPDGYDRFPLDSRYQKDRDRDSMPDAYEALYGLSLVSAADGAEDPDFDGVSNRYEFAAGTDPFVDEFGDSDGDGMPNWWELQYGLDPSNNDAYDDADGDGLENLAEFTEGTDPVDPDSDGDTLPDGFERLLGTDPLIDDGSQHADADDDGLDNFYEYAVQTDPLNPDTDGDGVEDGADIFPLDPAESLDSDHDGQGDVADTDDDNDGMPDLWENQYGLNSLSAADASLDLDGDALSNLDEFLAGTDPSDHSDPGNPFLHAEMLPSVSSDDWLTVTLPRTYVDPVVVTTPQYSVDSAPAVVRMQNVAGNQFDIRLQRADGLSDPLSLPVHFVVVEAGVYNIADHGILMEAGHFNSTETDRKGSWMGELFTPENTYSDPVVLGQVATFNDSRWSVFWNRGANRADPAATSSIYLGKHVGEDPDTARAAETLDYIVIQVGTVSVNDRQLVAGVGADTVRGPTNAAVTYTYAGPAAPQATILGQSAMDGGDGSWAVLRDVTTSATISPMVDEDQLANQERSHTTEQVGYLVIQ